MKILEYPHPTLRHKSKPLRKADRAFKKMVEEMFELMYEHEGVGLAANQVDLPYRFFITNTTGDPDIKDGEQVFINPVIKTRKSRIRSEEGCLSVPGIYEEVSRPEIITVSYIDMQGKCVEAEYSGLPAKAFQHELDHLDGVLFIDKLTELQQVDIREDLEILALNFDTDRSRGFIPSDEEIAKRLAELEKERT